MGRKKLQRETESYGLGQSGFTAGRIEGDPALGIVGRNISYPPGTDDHVLARGDDERFIGAGGKAWVPKDRREAVEVPEEAIDAAPAPAEPEHEPDPERSAERAQPESR